MKVKDVINWNLILKGAFNRNGKDINRNVKDMGEKMMNINTKSRIWMAERGMQNPT